MRRRPVGTTRSPGDASSADGKARPHGNEEGIAIRPAALWMSLFVLLLNGAWAVYHVQFERLPAPLTAEQAGKRGFSEERAIEHVKALTKFGPRPVGSDALDLAMQYVLTSTENIKASAHWEVDVQVDFFHTTSGANHLSGGLFRGKTHVYSDMKHVVVRILPKYLHEAEENVILVSSHVDTVFSTEGAGDCSSCIAVMLELARGISQWAHGFKSGIIFLFNTGEEEGLNGAHSFITQHPWRHTVRSVVDLEAMGIGGKSSIFQIGSDSWAIENYAKVAKHPAAQVISEDLFLSGLIKSATDFQVYSEIAGLSGLDFVYTDNSAVYHTKNDKLALLKPGSLQHLGDNMLAFLLHASMSSLSSKEKATQVTGHSHAVYFDILGKYMIVYRKRLAGMLQNSVILQAFLVWMTSMYIGGCPAVVALALSLLSIILMWILSLSLSVPIAFLLPYVCTHPLPFIANPWLVIGLFGAPAVVGALLGQHLGFLILHKYLFHSALTKNPLLVVPSDSIKLEAERWLYKAGLLQWHIILVMGSFFNAGSSYIALAWLICPAIAYGMIEATLTPARSAKRLRIITLLLGLSIPVLISGGIFIRLMSILIGGMVRIDRNPGSTPAWLGNVIVSIYAVAVVCLTLVYLLSYIHLSGSKRPLTILMAVIFSLTLAAVSSDVFPSFSNDVARGVNVVHVVDASERYANQVGPLSHVSIFSSTPGRFRNEMNSLKDEQFVCGKNSKLDFVTFTVNYDCRSTIDCSGGWTESEIPTFHVESDSIEEIRKTQVLMDTKVSTRWSLAVNTELIRDFTLEVNSDSNSSMLVENKKKNDGWHIIQFSGGKNSPTKFTLMLYWSKSGAYSAAGTLEQENSVFLLKLRTDVDRITPKTGRVLKLLPRWCSLFGKSTSPYTLAFFANLPVAF